MNSPPGDQQALALRQLAPLPLRQQSVLMSSRSGLGYLGRLPMEVRQKIYKMACNVEDEFLIQNQSGAYHNKLQDIALVKELKSIVDLVHISGSIRKEVLSEIFSHTVVHLFATYRIDPSHYTSYHRNAMFDNIHGQLVNRKPGVGGYRLVQRPSRILLSHPLLPVNVQHVSWIWTGEHQEIGQEDALDWMVELKQLKTLEVVIEDSNLHRRVTRSIATRRLASAATRDENIDLFKVINAEKLMKLRGLERMSFTLRFRDQADITRWQAAAWFTRFKEVVGTMARAPKEIATEFAHEQVVRHHLGALDRTRPTCERL